LNAFVQGCAVSFNFVSGLTAIIGALSIIKGNDLLKKMALYASIGLFLSAILSIAINKKRTDGTEPIWWAGLALGSVIAMIITNIIAGTVSSFSPKGDKLKSWGNCINSIIFIMSSIGIIIDIMSIIKDLFNIESMDPEDIGNEFALNQLLAYFALIVGGIGIGIGENTNDTLLAYSAVAITLLHIFAFLMLAESIT